MIPLSLEQLLTSLPATIRPEIGPEPQVFLTSLGLSGMVAARPQDLIYAVPERLLVSGQRVHYLDEECLFIQLAEAKKFSGQVLWPLLMHSQRFSMHREQLELMARQMGLNQIASPAQCQAWLAPWEAFEAKWPLYFHGVKPLADGMEWQFKFLATMRIAFDAASVSQALALRAGKVLQLELLPTPGTHTFNEQDLLSLVVNKP